jgi:hypothetical protein
MMGLISAASPFKLEGACSPGAYDEAPLTLAVPALDPPALAPLPEATPVAALAAFLAFVP